MDTPVNTENSDHDNASLLLPWYVNGTLDGSQKTLVEEHLGSCIVCRRTLVSERRTLEVFHNASPMDQSVQAGLERLRSSIAARTSPRSRKLLSGSAGVSWTRLLDTLRAFTELKRRPALVAAPLAVLAIGFVLTQVSREQSPASGGYVPTGAATVTDGYHTLSNPAVGVANPDEVRVIFVRGTNSETIEELFRSLPANIIDGPNSAGVYTIRLLDVSGDGERQAAIRGLRSQQQVIFAEAAQPLVYSNPQMAQPR